MVKKKKKVSVKNPWFKERDGKWSFYPLNWRGWVALLILIGLNVFGANYFGVMNVEFKQVSRFLVVFLLSIVVFILIAKKKTVGVKR